MADYERCKVNGCKNWANSFYGLCEYHFEEEKARRKKNKKSSKKPTRPAKIKSFWWDKN